MASHDVMTGLRRFLAANRNVTLVITLALICAAIPIDPIRVTARYFLVAYLPGLAIWNRVKPAKSSLVDLVLYPSLLSILSFSWIALACVAFGCNLWVAGWIGIALVLAAGFLLGWGGAINKTKDDRVVLGLSAVLVIFLLVIPFAANSFQAAAWDASLHAAIVSRILAGVVPPDSPMMAGEPANYYWLYHFYSAVLMRFTGLSIYQVFAVLNVHAFVLFVLGGYRIASRLTTSLFGRVSAVWMLVFGLNAFGWIVFLSYGSANPDRWYSFVSPFAMVYGYSPSLGSIIHEFLDGSPFAISFAFDIAWFDLLLARANGGEGRGLVVGALILATNLYLHPLSAVFLVAASLAAVGVLALIDRGRTIAERGALIFDLGVMIGAAALVTAPYAWNILHAKTGAPISLGFGLAFLKSQTLAIVAVVGVIAMIAAPALWSAFREKQTGALFLVFFSVAIAFASLFTHVALDAEYKLIYLLGFGLAPLVAIAWNFWNRTLLTRVVFALALAACVPTDALTSYCFASKPPRESRDPSRFRLLSWLREQTPGNAVLVEYPWWAKHQASDSPALYFYLDRYWFDIAVYAGRRQLIGYPAPMLEQWGYRDIELRQALARKLTAGEP